MSAYVDDLTGCLVTSNWRYVRSCHLVADSEAELILFGRKLGCSLEWLQRSRTGVPHFDLTAGIRERAIKAGAIEIDRKKVLALMKKIRSAKSALWA